MTQPEPEPTEYPKSWMPPHIRQQAEEIALAVDGYVAALCDEEFDALVARTRPGRGCANGHGKHLDQHLPRTHSVS